MMKKAEKERFEQMEFEFLRLLREKNPAWRLLAADQGPFIAAFLYKEFIAVNKRGVAEQELIERLDSFIYQLNQGGRKDLFVRSGREYLESWTNEQGWLRKFYKQGQDEICFDLTSMAQKAIEWLVNLQEPEFIGTESRLITVFDLLQQIAAGAETDPELRLAELKRRRAELDAEISRVENGQVDLLNDTQIKERFWQAMTTAREIIADFRAVEQNFRMLDREMRERIATWTEGKGALLELIFNEQDGIVDSEQGKSFTAFWKFLMSAAYQDDFKMTLDKVLNLQAVKEMSGFRSAARIHHEWMDAGAHVQETVAALSQQLRRYVDENFLEEERRILQLVREIEKSALQVRNDPPREWEIWLDAMEPEISLLMDRPLFSPPQRPEIKNDLICAGIEDVSAQALFSQVYVDKEALAARIDGMLRVTQTVSLAEVVRRFPLRLGLAELVTYLVIGSEGSPNRFVAGEKETVFWTDEQGREQRATLPRILFVRK